VDLFDHRRTQDTAARAPLADRMRPRTLDEFAGQAHIIGPGRLLRRAIEADQLTSLIFFGPPGTGKTTLARIIANTTEAHFTALNAVLAGVKDIRAAVADAEERRGLYGRRSILFVDEVHRFNKAQQDALLPWVENGTVVFIGATTENPYFEVNKALVSRSRVFQLRPLETEDLRALARAALADPERGYGQRDAEITDEALDHLVDVANGDARAVLNALELAAETTPPDADGRIVIDLAVAEESIQHRAVLYDKEGDVHYDTISAFIKSVRGGDPDAALYWLARMVYAGEHPRFIFRRLLILAAEDVGLADPDAVRVVTACAQAFEYIGLPEGQFHLAEATLYLATAPKSNSTLAYFDALDAVQKERVDDIPTHLKDTNRDAEAFGHGAGYLYPHAYRDHWVAQQYLPGALQGRVFYQPSDQGYERAVRDTTARRREAQLAAMVEGTLDAAGETLTFTGAAAGRDRERWLARAIGNSGERLGALRDRVLDAAGIARHSVVLDLRAQTGLLTWDAARRTPEGGVWALAGDPEAARVLESGAVGKGGAGGAGASGNLDAPTILIGALPELPELLALRGETELRFDALVGRNVFGGLARADWAAAAAVIGALLAPGGRLGLAESLPSRGSRPSDLLVGASGAVDELVKRLREAEAQLYADDLQLGWGPEDLVHCLESAGLAEVRVEIAEESVELLITDSLVARWFDPGATYAARLADMLAPDEIAAVRARLAALVGGPARTWRVATAYVGGTVNHTLT
jgi:putative ATPase